jgi:spore maturation protein CgeB
MKRKILGIMPSGVIAPFVSQDIYAALKALGHDILVIDIENLRRAVAAGGIQARDELIRTIRSFQPDFAMFYAVCGILRFSEIHTKSTDHLLADLNIPIFPCFFDDPNFILGIQPDMELTEETLLFVWDKVYLEDMKKRGYRHSQHLPLGTNPDIFRPLKKKQTKYRHALSFVGTIQDIQDKMEVLEGVPDFVKEIFEKSIRRKLRNPSRSFHEILPSVAQHLPENEWCLWQEFLKSKDYWRFFNALNQVTNNIWREQVVTSIALNEVDIAVYGNSLWEKHDVHYCGKIDYHRALPRLYASTPLHLNLTAPQLFTAINNRIYDVLAAGSAILTDWRQSLEEAFDPEKELIVFNTVEEAVELAKKWCRPEMLEALQKIADTGRRRVLAEHTWGHRMQSALTHIEAYLETLAG